MRILIIISLLTFSVIQLFSQNEIKEPEPYLIGGLKDTVIYFNESWCRVSDTSDAFIIRNVRLIAIINYRVSLEVIMCLMAN